MKLMTHLAVLFYMTTILLFGCLLILFVLNFIPLQAVLDAFYMIYYDQQLRLLFGIIALVVLINNYIFARAISGSQQREKTIAFDNPVGRVSVSLAALEDLIRRLISKVPEVKEVRSSIKAGKKGIEINSRLVLNTDVNIPEMTSRLQDIVKRKIQDTIGIEGPVIVRVHVTKIIAGSSKATRRPREADEKNSESQVPFPGYRA